MADCLSVHEEFKEQIEDALVNGSTENLVDLIKNASKRRILPFVSEPLFKNLPKVIEYFEKSDLYTEDIIFNILLAILSGAKRISDGRPDLSNTHFLDSLCQYAQKQQTSIKNRITCFDILVVTLDAWNFKLASPQNSFVRLEDVMVVYRKIAKIERSIPERINLSRTLSLIKLLGPLNRLMDPFYIDLYPYAFLSDYFFKYCKDFKIINENYGTFNALLSTYKKNLMRMRGSVVIRSYLKITIPVLIRHAQMPFDLTQIPVKTSVISSTLDSFNFLRQNELITADSIENPATIREHLGNHLVIKSPPKFIWEFILDRMANRGKHVYDFDTVLESMLSIHNKFHLYDSDYFIHRFLSLNGTKSVSYDNVLQIPPTSSNKIKFSGTKEFKSYMTNFFNLPDKI